MRFAVALALGALVLSGCRAEDSAAIAKFDAPLRMKAESLAREHRVETLSVFGKCSRDLDEPMKKSMEKTGASLTTVQGDLFTARISSDRLTRLGALDFVTQLQLAQTSEPSSH